MRIKPTHDEPNSAIAGLDPAIHPLRKNIYTSAAADDGCADQARA
jgi:hypothetical protein